jgi:hypothetical protein
VRLFLDYQSEFLTSSLGEGSEIVHPAWQKVISLTACNRNGKNYASTFVHCIGLIERDRKIGLLRNLP